VYEFFDVGRLNAMSLQQLREACKGAGLDLDDDEVEARMRARKPSMLFTLDDFIALNLEELQTGDSKDDVVAAFRAIGGGGSSTLSEDQINTLFMSDPEVAEYLRNNLNDEDFASFTDKLFTR
jgi:Ca2+-binding EF-hand superfamily protein